MKPLRDILEDRAAADRRWDAAAACMLSILEIVGDDSPQYIRASKIQFLILRAMEQSEAERDGALPSEN